MSALIFIIWGNLAGTWKGKILASGITAAILIGFGYIMAGNSNDKTIGLILVLPLSFIFGTLVSVYLLIGILLNNLFKNRHSSNMRSTINVACFMYSISLIPISALFVYCAYQIISMNIEMA